MIKGIIFLHRSGFYYCNNAVSSILQLSFTQEAVKNMEVVSKEQLFYQVKVFVDTGGLMRGNLIIALSDSIIFKKDVVRTPKPIENQNQAPDWQNKPPNQEEQQAVSKPDHQEADEPAQNDLAQNNSNQETEALVKQFIDNVPYEETIIKKIALENGVRVFVANKSFIDALNETFRKLGFIIDSVIPVAALSENYENVDSLSLELANLIFQKYDYLKESTMIPNQELVSKKQDLSREANNMKPKNKRVYFLAGVLGILLLILVILLFTTMQPAKPTPDLRNTSSQSQP